MSAQTLQNVRTKVFDLIKNKHFKEASLLATVLCDKYPDDFESHILLSAALLNSEQYYEAEKMLKQAIAKFPDDWQFHELLGNVYGFLDKIPDSEKEYRIALSKVINAPKAEIADIRCALADTLWVQNKRDLALDEWRTALKIYPQCIEAKERLKECTNFYGEPKAPNEYFDDLYHFQGIHIKRYLALVGRKEFISEAEMQIVLDIVRTGWNNNIPPRLQEFDQMTAKQKSAFFKSITLNFTKPVTKWRKKL